MQSSNLLAENKLLKQEVSQKDQRIKLLEEMLRLQRHKQFGASSEKESAGQGQLFDEAESDSDIEDPIAEEITVPAHTRKKKKRVSIPSDLPREDIIHDLSEAEKICPHDGAALKCIGNEISEQLDIVPAKIKVLRHLRKKYACPCCEQHLITAPKPAQPIEKSIASPGLLAHVAVSKYRDALPLYRQIAIFKRIGVELDRTTLANWMIKMGSLLQPLINRLSEFINEQSVLHMDETPLQVLNEPGKRAQSQSYMWVMTTTQASVPIVLYHYSASRSGDIPKELLPDFNGALMVDGYEGYAAVCNENRLTRLGCWAHARRKFIDAQRQQPKGKTGKADVALGFIQKLYRIEKLNKDKSINERFEARQTQAKPIIDTLKQWLDKSFANTPPKTTLGKALQYLHNQWPRLVPYLDDGSSQTGAHASANLYSLIETAKVNELDPYAYLKQLFTMLPQAKGLEDIDELLPWNVQGVVG
ncbi:MAG: IS66 family transposase [Gammaproteobacteria bacterium]|jgi:transposase|nr:IS66 family transposase [Gammaproteobacteria bacterium]MBQ0775200.1 IS66 family transposase [Gammaproteobacteria bacterium]MDF1781159.1 IS66 family transposase [Alcanivoracaceae bacterium]|tara:strand:+ start:46066 stop:47487 length:1422 start_codon:yes stop_codon:yes gene_type:complete